MEKLRQHQIKFLDQLKEKIIAYIDDQIDDWQKLRDETYSTIDLNEIVMFNTILIALDELVESEYSKENTSKIIQIILDYQSIRSPLDNRVIIEELMENLYTETIPYRKINCTKDVYEVLNDIYASTLDEIACNNM